MAGKRTKNGRYIPKNIITTAPKPKLGSSFEFTARNILKYTFGVLLLSFFMPLLVDFVKIKFPDFFSTAKTANAYLTLKDYKYERETPNYEVFAVNFTINNAGNQDLTLIQAIPYDAYEASTINLLQNNSCESYKNETIEEGKLKDFTMHVFVTKDSIELMKIQEKTRLKQYSLTNSQFGKKIKPIFSAARFYVTAKVLISGADNINRGAVSAPFEMLYSKREVISDPTEIFPKSIPIPVEFQVRDTYFYNCPIKNVKE